MKILIFLTLSTFAAAAFYQIHLARFESAMTKMRKAGIWKDHIMNKGVISDITHKTNKKHTQNVFDYEDSEYFVNITIGTPGQLFKVIFDTASSFLFVPDITCKDEIDPACDQCMQYGGPLCQVFCDDPARSKSANKENAKGGSIDLKITGCTGKNKFDQQQSSSYVVVGTQLNYTYEFGPIRAFLGNDTIRFGESATESLTVPNVDFGQATFINSAFALFSSDGVLGVAFPDFNDNKVASPFFEAIKQGLVDKPIFTVFLREGDVQGENGGVITYGGLDDVNCGSDIAYENIFPTKELKYLFYQFKLKSVKLRSYSSEEGWDAIADTSMSYITGPPTDIEGLAEAAGAHFDEEEYCYLIDCNAQPEDIEFGIGSKTYKINNKNYIGKPEKESGKCCLRIFDYSGLGFGPIWTFGYPFLRSYCTVYDVGGKRIGFASPKQK